MDQSKATVNDGRILFPEEMKVSAIKEFCGSCFHNVDCGGPQSGGGSIYADNHNSKVADAEIRQHANCLRGKER